MIEDLARSETAVTRREVIAALASAAHFAVTIVEPETPASASLAAGRVVGDLASVALTLRTAVVVATHGRSDEDALEQALRSEADYVSLGTTFLRRRTASGRVDIPWQHIEVVRFTR